MSTAVLLGIFPKMRTGERPFHEIVQARLDELGENPFSIAGKSGISYDKIRSVIRQDHRRADPKVETAREICAALDLEFYIGPRRDLKSAPSTTVSGEQFATVARYDAAGAAGNGTINLDGPPIDHLAFSKRWLEQNGISAGDSILINVRGDSMEPSIYDGDLVMIDRRKTQIRSGRIYVFREGDSLRIKRLELIPDAAIILRSDNPKYPPEHRVGPAMNTVSLGLIGEVVWSGHKWG